MWQWLIFSAWSNWLVRQDKRYAFRVDPLPNLRILDLRFQRFRSRYSCLSISLQWAFSSTISHLVSRYLFYLSFTLRGGPSKNLILQCGDGMQDDSCYTSRLFFLCFDCFPLARQAFIYYILRGGCILLCSTRRITLLFRDANPWMTSVAYDIPLCSRDTVPRGAICSANFSLLI